MDAKSKCSHTCDCIRYRFICLLQVSTVHLCIDDVEVSWTTWVSSKTLSGQKPSGQNDLHFVFSHTVVPPQLTYSIAWLAATQKVSHAVNIEWWNTVYCLKGIKTPIAWIIIIIHAVTQVHVHKVKTWIRNSTCCAMPLDFFLIQIFCCAFWMPRCDVRDGTYWHQADLFCSFRAGLQG